MSYQLNRITIRTNNSEQGMKKLQQVWDDIMNGKLPVLYDTELNYQDGTVIVSEYNNYESDETGDYDFTIVRETMQFFERMEELVKIGQYKKYDFTDEQGQVAQCTQQAWKCVWREQAEQLIHRAFTKDYECSILPQYSLDGKAHCYLYIAVK